MSPGRPQTHDERYLAALRQLWDRSEYDRGFISNPFAGDETARLGLRRTEALLDRLGAPQARYGQPRSEAAGAAAWERALAAAVELERDRPDLDGFTAFELVTAMALDHFAVARCDAAIIEVGLGGALDATNVVTPVSTAIAALDYEHTRVLGTTMTEIAANKAGIIKPGVPLATSRLPAEAMPVIAATVHRQRSPWFL